MNEVDKHVKRLKELILGHINPKNKSQSLTVTPGTWVTHEDEEWRIVGFENKNGSYNITWKNKKEEELSKEQSVVNFDYVCCLNPTMLLKLLEEYERLKSMENKSS